MVAVDEPPGLRERKKQQTWGLIAQTAHRLFQEHGFDAVTVTDVAREADVSRKTVFNYFPTKEDLFYSGLEFFEARLLDAIRERKPGESILAAFERFVTEPRGLLAAGDPDASDPDAGERLLAIIRVITDSSALLAREQQIYAGYAAALAALIAEETHASPDDIAPWVAANSIIGLHKALVDYVRRRVLAGERDRARIARGLRAQARQAVALLEHGLGHLGAGGVTAG
jgi:AcrR family transcriptional regulator